VKPVIVDDVGYVLERLAIRQLHPKPLRTLSPHVCDVGGVHDGQFEETGIAVSPGDKRLLLDAP
jgi:hypothetical protein